MVRGRGKRREKEGNGGERAGDGQEEGTEIMSLRAQGRCGEEPAVTST